ncbi:ABC-type nitrate/sulfonate/bicarbonate transport system, permease component [Desulfitobacterium dichloroeliminans LMG P-21439]|uniref:ABC-type nitrate/sulfonate/bicarbonate transport system, permease component n=1 Tax=Desulfitobacterium dichloroeliminans (strain LMG P-21439 / DCA1) TaxID=871963 RepID=L0F5F7_DESDL|nr:ABC transporter permease [Desulfitobacterium dichloroeliminans]AGA68178.1 ABC-type nitrate/sulfonate/bicarbonate transport system, permease component [Desulfitobacterium dichloroeliminans LMG P-21439]
MKRLQSITNRLYPAAVLLGLLLIWYAVTFLEVVPKFMLPSPGDVVRALIRSFPDLMIHARITLTEAFVGLTISILLAFWIALLMDRFEGLYKALHPILVITQTIPTVAIAPLLVLWMGFDMAPKITLIVLTCFFPMTIALLGGFKSSDQDAMNLMRAMGAKKWQIYRYIKLPNALPGFFSGLRISVSYSIVGAVIAEWLGGNSGLGVYMTRVRKSYSFDKMFAVIFLIIILSLVLMKCVELIERRAMPWLQTEDVQKEA